MKKEVTNSDEDREYTVPEKIIGFTADSSGSEIKISWKAVKDFGHYELVRRIPGSNKWVFLDKNLLVENCIDDSSGNITKCEYRVRAVNVSGPGPWSDILTV